LRQRVCIRRCHRSPIDFLRGPTSTSRTHATVQPFPGRPPLGRLTNDRRNFAVVEDVDCSLPMAVAYGTSNLHRFSTSVSNPDIPFGFLSTGASPARPWKPASSRIAETVLIPLPGSPRCPICKYFLGVAPVIFDSCMF
jgi:hypothetical protein